MPVSDAFLRIYVEVLPHQEVGSPSLVQSELRDLEVNLRALPVTTMAGRHPIWRTRADARLLDIEHTAPHQTQIIVTEVRTAPRRPSP